MKKIGIVGGLGPETSCKLCLDLNREARTLIKQQPDIIMTNVALTKKSEKKVIEGDVDNKLRQQLKDSVNELNKTDVDIIIIPCNTVHIHIDELRKTSKKPVISIIEECAKTCRKQGLKKVGILGTHTTIQQSLHQDQLIIQDIIPIVPENESQEIVSSTIKRILDNKATTEDKKNLIRVINELKEDGAQAVILGCTDLDILVNQQDTDVKLIDSVEVLKEKILTEIIKN